MISVPVFNLPLKFDIPFIFLHFNKNYLSKTNIFSLSLPRYFVKLLKKHIIIKYYLCLFFSTVESFSLYVYSLIFICLKK